MHTCREIIDALSEYLEGDLSREEIKHFEQHMCDCPPCHVFLKTYRKSGELAREVLYEQEVPQELQDRVRDFLKARLGLDK